MKTEEKVKINLTGKANPPFKTAKIKNTRPTHHNFKFAPKNFVHLNDYVKSVHWNSVQKKLHLIVKETPKFEVMKWLEFLDNQYHDSQRSPFVDVDIATIQMTFLDDSDRDVATVRFKGLKLEDHNSYLFRLSERQEAGQTTIGDQSLSHHVTLLYQFAEVVVHADKVPDEQEAMDDEGEDNEWMTVEVPG